MTHSIGILAYGSLIDDPGDELEKAIVTTLDTTTPFVVEYGRKSINRGGAPTMTISVKGGANVNAKILVLDSNIDLKMAKDMLYRRELSIPDLTREYIEPGVNSLRMRIRSLSNFLNIETVIYADLPANIEPVTPEKLATLAIGSALTDAGEQKRDGINYLKNNIGNGIVTPLTHGYVHEILKQTGTNSLEKAIEFLDIRRGELRTA